MLFINNHLQHLLTDLHCISKQIDWIDRLWLIASKFWPQKPKTLSLNQIFERKKPKFRQKIYLKTCKKEIVSLKIFFTFYFIFF